jgi:hypothetical protein
MNSYYTPSGKYSPTSFILLLVLCFTAFPLLGGLYTYAIWFIPFIYVNFLITAAFAFSIGILMHKIVFRFGKVRNIRLGIVLAFLGGFAALYVHWVVWADLILNSTEVIGTSRIGIVKTSTNLDNLLTIATQPKLLFQLMMEVSEYGTWGLFGMTISGAMLWIIWVLEALTILTGSVMIGIWQTKQPFCERSNTWFKDRALPPTSFIISKEDLVNELELGKDHILSSLHLHDVVFDNASYSQFTVYSSDQNEHYLSAQNMKKRVGSKGEVEYEEDPIIELISISSKTLKLLEGAKRESKGELGDEQ